jgi:uncharacterized membrane protein
MSALWLHRTNGLLMLTLAIVVIWAHFGLYAAISMCCALLLGVYIGRRT